MTEIDWTETPTYTPTIRVDPVRVVTWVAVIAICGAFWTAVISAIV